jgi:hypothetical protein
MKSLSKEQVEQCNTVIHTYLSNLPVAKISRVTLTDLMESIRESSSPDIKDLTMSRCTFHKHFGKMSHIKRRYNIKPRSEPWHADHREKVKDVFYEILSSLEPEQMLRISLKDLRSKAIEKYPDLHIESKGLPVLRSYFAITELKSKAFLALMERV